MGLKVEDTRILISKATRDKIKIEAIKNKMKLYEFIEYIISEYIKANENK